MKHCRLVAILILLVLAVMIALPLPALAIADPDTPPQVSAVYVYEDLLVEGDAGVLIDYFLDYSITGNPTETATEAYLAVFIDTDGVTQLKSVAPYTFQDDGYGRGLIWIYFTAAEVTTHGIDSANELLYKIWLVGNPTLAWAGDPPKTVVGIDYWQPAATSTSTLVALRVLSYAQILSGAWGAGYDLIQETASGNRLTAQGESYFSNVIQDLRTIAPNAFSSGEFAPTLEELDYSTVFGATLTDLTGTAAGSPITLVEGANIVDVTGLGTFTLELEKGTEGTAASGGGGECVVTGSPVDLVAGINTITTTAPIGDIIVTVNLVNTQTAIVDNITGTGFDLDLSIGGSPGLATRFGMERGLFSGMVWLVISIIICAAVYRVSDRGGGYGGSGKAVMLVFNICIVGGAVLGLMPILIAVLMFIGFGALTGYVLFFRHANV